ncbi:hydroxypyruvate isomerase family protein [Flexivirga caeni]|uniref:Hydroxypyruvate isomerase n=1 Tax=Flexivirga caeni TaxID=2294115 RepID=A0A3M9M4F4_9MICO|nr:TIM barrel protein [Flexivirga caeni]RNI20420.1 hydroxypyruvate isomerase [Flexivirga caeni]
MTRYTVNASILLTDLPLLDRPAAARAAGFDAVEFWWPWPATALPSAGEVDEFVAAIDDAGVALTGLNFFAGDMPAGDRGIVNNPSRVDEFTANVDLVVDIAGRTGCRHFNALYGLHDDGVDAEAEATTARANLAHAAAKVGELGGTVLLEPVSGAPAYPLKTAADALGVIEQVGAGNLRLLADFYHLAVNGDDVAHVIAEHAARFGHVQIADAPGRGAPGSGDLPLLDWIAAAQEGGYDGPVGLEYLAGDTDPFAWVNS